MCTLTQGLSRVAEIIKLPNLDANSGGGGYE